MILARLLKISQLLKSGGADRKHPYMFYINIYDSQIVHLNPCFNLFILNNDSFDSQGSETNKSDIFYVSKIFINWMVIIK